MEKIVLTVPQPCHENWKTMTSDEKGRFCGACQKTVIDFSQFSDRQLAEFFKKPVDTVCGRFYPDQLERVLTVPKKRIPWVKYFFTISLPAFLLTLKAGAQNNTRTLGKVAVCVKPTGKDSLVVPEKIPATKTIKGRIINEKGEPVGYASIIIEESLRGWITNEAGEFEIKDVTAAEASVKISAVGFEQKIFSMAELSAGKPVTIHLSAVTMGEVVVTMGLVAVKKKTPDVPLIQMPKMDSVFSRFAVYPNPVVANSIFTLEPKSLEDGDYNMQILTSTGQVVQAKAVNISRKIRRINITLEPITPGPYFVQLINKKNNKNYTEIIIVK
jgi:hypothetical protein